MEINRGEANLAKILGILDDSSERNWRAQPHFTLARGRISVPGTPVSVSTGDPGERKELGCHG